MNIKPAVYDLFIQRGDDFSFTFDIEADGVVVPVDGATILSDIREKEEANSTLIVPFTVSANTTTDEITLSLTDVQTEAVLKSSGYYDVLFEQSDDVTHYLKGKVAFSNTVTPCVASSVVITSPSANDAPTAPANVTFSANVTTGTARTISKVEFYADDVLLNSDTSAPYTYAWTGVAAGTYDLVAKVYDDKSNYSSETVTFTVMP